MDKFKQGQVVVLKSDSTLKGAVINILDGPETRYQVFVGGQTGIQVYYESQLEAEQEEHGLNGVSAERFHAGLTASLIRNPSLSSLYSLNTAKIDFIPHQFRPVLKFIRSDRPRLLIADGVGVGKTIEAGLILRELQARRNLDSVLIICPRPLVSERKWEEEMKRFDEDFTALDGEKFRYCIKELDMEGEWPEKYKKAIIPYSLFDEGNVFGSESGRRRKIGLMQTEPPIFDLVIVDEAHHIRNTATYGYKAVSRFCDAAEAVIFLTATPVQLEYDDLFVLLNLLRPDLIIDKNTFHNMAKPNEFISRASVFARGMQKGWQDAAYDEIICACNTNWGKAVFAEHPMVQTILHTLKKPEITTEERVQLIADIENMHTFSNIISRTRRRDIGEFTVRKPVTVKVDFTEEQKELHDNILSIIHDILSKIHCTTNTKFMMNTIRRQTASCLFGLVPMLEDILYRHIYEITEDDLSDGEISENENGIDIFTERIHQILDLAKKLPQNDPKLDAMMEVIRKKQREEKNKIMIFSSFKHTLNYLYQNLRNRGFRVGMIHGGVSDEERAELRKRFEPSQLQQDAKEAIDILLFSEVGCEGLDYQFCDCMINYDLPWNPMRVEQRIGRIDRNGQTSESVSIYNMVTTGTIDADIYERCLMRIGVFHNSIGDCEEILGEITGEIHKVADNFELTDEERRNKLQQMTDNKVRFLKEQESLEEKQRDLFGIQVPKTSFDTELENATNYWLSSENLLNLAACYLKIRLGSEKEYILGEKELKTLRLSQNARKILLDDFKKAGFPKNETNRTWEKWLKSGEQHLSISFDNKCCQKNPHTMFISVTHPFIKQAAYCLEGKGKIAASLKVKTDKFQPGEYPFAVFQWKFLGEKEDLQMKPISSDSNLNQILLQLLQESYGGEVFENMDVSRWETVETIHHHMWEDALKEHKRKTAELIRYKEASLETSHLARMDSLNDLLEKSTDKKYRIMTKGKIINAREDFAQHMEHLQKAKEKADILFELLAYGLLVIEPKDCMISI